MEVSNRPPVIPENPPIPPIIPEAPKLNRKEQRRREMELQTCPTRQEVENYVNHIAENVYGQMRSYLDTRLRDMQDTVVPLHVAFLAFKDLLVEKTVFTEDDFVNKCKEIEQELHQQFVTENDLQPPALEPEHSRECSCNSCKPDGVDSEEN